MNIWRSRTAISAEKTKLVNRLIEARDGLKIERGKVCEDNDLDIAELEKEVIELQARVDTLRWVEGQESWSEKG